MEESEDLGLELLMNSKKKVASDALSVSSGRSSSISLSRRSGGSGAPTAEPVDVQKHLVPPSRPDSSIQEDDEEFSYDEDDVEADDYTSGESQGGYSEARPQRHAGASRPHYTQPTPARLSEEDIIAEKKELLYQFERMERKGMRLPRKFTLASSLEDMRMEYERLKRDRELDASIKWQKRMMMTAVSGIEFASEKMTWIGANLNGWSSTVNDELDEYEDVFVELHDKYKGKAKIAPELRLLGGLAGSAFMYHMTNRFSQQLPGLDQVLKSNPELAAKLAEATRSQMNSQQQQAGNFFGGLGGMFGNLFGGMGGPTPPPPMPADMAPQKPSARQSGVRMKGPSNMDDILSELNAKQSDRVELMSTISESELSELPDDVSSIHGLFNKKGAKSIDLDI